MNHPLDNQTILTPVKFPDELDDYDLQDFNVILDKIDRLYLIKNDSNHRQWSVSGRQIYYAKRRNKWTKVYFKLASWEYDRYGNGNCYRGSIKFASFNPISFLNIVIGKHDTNKQTIYASLLEDGEVSKRYDIIDTLIELSNR